MNKGLFEGNGGVKKKIVNTGFCKVINSLKTKPIHGR